MQPSCGTARLKSLPVGGKVGHTWIPGDMQVVCLHTAYSGKVASGLAFGVASVRASATLVEGLCMNG